MSISPTNLNETGPGVSSPLTPSVAPSSSPPPSSSSSSSSSFNSDSSASLTGGVARAGSAVWGTSLRVLGSLYRVPLKSFRQNKFDLAEGHQSLAHSAVGASSSSNPKPAKPLKTLLSHHGTLHAVTRQVVPALLANVAVGTIMFQTFDRTMAVLAVEGRIEKRIPEWICSQSLSTGAIQCGTGGAAPTTSHDTCHPLSHMPYVGPDVFIAGALAGAAQSVLVTPMENSATHIRAMYRIAADQAEMRATLHANASPPIGTPASAAAGAGVSATATGATAQPHPHPHPHHSHHHHHYHPHGHISVPRVTPAVLESTALGLEPPAPPAHIPRLSIFSSVRAMPLLQSGIAFPGHATHSTAVTAAAASHSPSPFIPVALYSHASFRCVRDALGIGVFFYLFEQTHALMRRVPYQWMQMEEDRHRATIEVEESNNLSVYPSLPPPPSYLLGSLLAWDAVSVVTAGAVAGSAYHLVSAPFYTILQRLETHALAAHPPHPMSAWSECLSFCRARPGNWRHLFTQLRAPKLFNPMVIGLCVYTLTKTEQHTQQWQEWRNERHKQRQTRSAKANPTPNNEQITKQ